VESDLATCQGDLATCLAAPRGQLIDGEHAVTLAVKVAKHDEGWLPAGDLRAFKRL
jgi:hypothetical protein